MTAGAVLDTKDTRQPRRLTRGLPISHFHSVEASDEKGGASDHCI